MHHSGQSAEKPKDSKYLNSPEHQKFKDKIWTRPNSHLCNPFEFCLL